MRTSDLEALSKPFLAPNAEAADAHFCDSLNVGVPIAHSLYLEVAQDADPDKGGVRWWADHLDAQRNILVADHLLAALASLSENLAEAALHQLAYLEAQEGIQRRMVRYVAPDGKTAIPPATCAADLLPSKLATLHTAGIFRAVGSTFDCLAAAIIGVLGVPKDILKADFAGVMRWLRGEGQKAVARAPMQVDFRQAEESILERAGPEGWFEWADAYRNMYVHRGRRMSLSKLDVSAHVVGPDGRPIPHTKVQPLLLAEPAISNMESWVRFRRSPITLSETAPDTMMGLLKSSVYVVEHTCRQLIPIWQSRRLAPELLLQPKEQWPNVLPASKQFSGYRPGTVRVQSDTVVTNPTTTQRIAAAGVADPSKGPWPAS